MRHRETYNNPTRYFQDTCFYLAGHVFADSLGLDSSHSLSHSLEFETPYSNASAVVSSMEPSPARGLLAALSFLSLFAACITGVQANSPSLPLPLRLLHQLSLGSWIENLWVRSNGDILLSTLAPNASVYLISDPTVASPDVSLIYTFGSMHGILGIIETKPDVFVVVGSNYSELGRPVNGTSAAWELDFHYPSKPSAREITAMPDAIFLNGIESVPSSDTTLLIADSTRGLVWRLNTLTGNYGIAIQNPAMDAPAGAPLAIGINGIRVHNGYLYWTNSYEATFYRLRITADGYPAPGAAVQVVGKADAEFLDDLFIGPVGKDIIWSPTNLDNMLVALNPRANEPAVVVEGSPSRLTVAGGTACQFGRGQTDQQILYVATSGGIANPVNGTVTEGGKIVAVDTSSYFQRESGLPYVA